MFPPLKLKIFHFSCISSYPFFFMCGWTSLVSWNPALTLVSNNLSQVRSSMSKICPKAGFMPWLFIRVSILPNFSIAKSTNFFWSSVLLTFPAIPTAFFTPFDFRYCIASSTFFWFLLPITTEAPSRPILSAIARPILKNWRVKAGNWKKKITYPLVAAVTIATWPSSLRQVVITFEVLK